MLGGGVSAAGDFLLNAVREKLPEMVFYKTMPYARIELAHAWATTPASSARPCWASKDFIKRRGGFFGGRR